jgi:hypothetical protein
MLRAAGATIIHGPECNTFASMGTIRGLYSRPGQVLQTEQSDAHCQAWGWCFLWCTTSMAPDHDHPIGSKYIRWSRRSALTRLIWGFSERLTFWCGRQSKKCRGAGVDKVWPSIKDESGRLGMDT